MNSAAKRAQEENRRPALPETGREKAPAVTSARLKYRKSGGGWSFFIGISRPSALRK